MAGSLTCVSVTLLVLCHGVVGPSTPFLGAGVTSVGNSAVWRVPHHCCVSLAACAMSRQRGWAQGAGGSSVKRTQLVPSLL
jgi:hypothetical protein